MKFPGHCGTHLFTALLMAGISEGAAQSPVLPVETLLSVATFDPANPVSLSPDGNWVAYSLQRMTPPGSGQKDSPGSASIVRVVNSATAETIDVLPDSVSTWGATWSPVTTRVAFLARQRGHARLWVWDVASRRAHEVVPYDLGTAAPQWSADGRNVLVDMGARSASARNEQLNPPDTIGVTVRQFDTTRGSVLSVLSLAHDRSGRELALVNLQTRRIVRRTVVGQVRSYLLAPSGAAVVVTLSRQGEEPVPGQRIDVAVLQIDDGQVRVLAAAVPVLERTLAWSHDGNRVAYCTDGGTCYVVQVRDSASVELSAPPGVRFSAIRPVWAMGTDTVLVASSDALWAASSDGRRVREIAHFGRRRIVWFGMPHGSWPGLVSSGELSLFVATVDDSTLDAGVERVEVPADRVTMVATVGKAFSPVRGPIVHLATSGDTYSALLEGFDHLPEVWIGSSRGGEPRQLTHTNVALDHYQMGSVRLLHWLDGNGRPCRGRLMLPPDYRVERRYPLIVTLYPGDSASKSLHQFSGASVPLQLYTTRGYAVLQPDVPLSAGYPMRDIARAVLPAIKETVALGIADSARVGVVGVSFGGYAALALAVQSSQLRAAVSIDGLDNMINPYTQPPGAGGGNPWVQDTVWALGGHMGGSLWRVRDRYIENSPLFYFDRVTAPVLLIHGERDTSIPVVLAEQSFHALRALGKTVTLVTYVGAGHGWPGWSLAQQIDMNERVLSWFAQYLGGP